MGKLSTRVAGVAGIVFVLLIALPGFASGSPPDTDHSAREFATYLASNRSAIILSGFAGAMADFFVVFFLAGLYTTLRRLGAATNLLVASLIAIVLTGALASAGGMVEAGAAFRFNGSQHVDATVAQMAFDVSIMAFTLIGFTLAAFLLTTATMMSGARHFPQWLSWVGWVGAAMEVVGTASVFGTSGFFGLEGPAGLLFGLIPLGVFTLATSIVMIVRGDAMDGASTAAAAPAQAAPTMA